MCSRCAGIIVIGTIAIGTTAVGTTAIGTIAIRVIATGTTGTGTIAVGATEPLGGIARSSVARFSTHFRAAWRLLGLVSGVADRRYVSAN